MPARFFAFRKPGCDAREQRRRRGVPKPQLEGRSERAGKKSRENPRTDFLNFQKKFTRSSRNQQVEKFREDESGVCWKPMKVPGRPHPRVSSKVGRR